jgi:hypothetical protein
MTIKEDKTDFHKQHLMQTLEGALSPVEPKRQEKDLDVLKELFIPKNIEMKSELNTSQLNEFNKKRAISSMLQWDTLEEVLQDFLMCSVSHDRKGRLEFIEGFKSNRDNQIPQPQQGMIGRAMGWLGK